MTFPHTQHSEQSRSDGTGTGPHTSSLPQVSVPNNPARFSRFCCFVAVVLWTVAFAQIGTKAIANLSHFHHENGLYPHD